ncbi:MAG: oxidoreductase [Deltaproteobacteria bacterium HGW-Deltaproteobacteria-8]|jgi:2,4-dienoyl-CoA reductase-like NADH-dependent reductase (Old Yellow Enzyme family)|nr:MAG: oxidoreductase [Deltaproteobacteria bacterium HGW-Deltaproteobacteria-8]
MSTLFSPFVLGPLTLENRIVIAPMCQYSSTNGEANDWHLAHLGGLSLSGAGLLIIEATAVEPEGRITPADLGLWSDECEAALARVLGFIRQHSPIRVGIQLAHAGRKASCALPWKGGDNIPSAEPEGWVTQAPSALCYAPGDEPPQALDQAGLERVRQAFVAAARRAVRLGLDCVELHCAHGYLLHEFLSPLSNQRTDEYGGSLENRMRLPLEIFQAMRAVLPAHMPLGVRISATDWVPKEMNGWDEDQSVVFSRELEKLGAAYIHVSSGGLSPEQKIPVGPGYQLPQARRIKAGTGLPVIAVGLITQAAQAEEILTSGQADLVALARAMLYDPRWAWHAAAELGARVHAPPQYLRCQPHGLKDLFKTK